MVGRSPHRRITDTLGRLNADSNVWVATSSPDGIPHLIPLSLMWDGEVVLLATPVDSPTVRNLSATGRVRLALDDADDVTVISGTATWMDYATADASTRAGFADRAGWDPGAEPGAWALITVTPDLVQAWCSVEEITGRTIMRDGVWVATAESPP